MSIQAFLQSMQQHAAQPSIGQRYMQGQDDKREQEEREFRRAQIEQQMALAERGEERTAARFEEEMSDPMVEARLNQALGQSAIGRAQHETAVEKAHADLQKSQVDAAYAETHAQQKVRSMEANIRQSNAAAQLSQVNAQLKQIEIQQATDPRNLELQEIERTARAEKARLEAIQNGIMIDYYTEGEGREHFEAEKMANHHQHLATAQTAIEAANLGLRLTNAQASQIEDTLNLPADVRVMMKTDLGRHQMTARALEEIVENDPANFEAARELADTYAKIDKIKTITGTSEYDHVFRSEAVMDRQMEARDELTRGIREIDNMLRVISEDPTRAGLVGTVRATVQQLADVGSDLSLVFGDASPMAGRLMDTATRMAANDLRSGNIDRPTYEAWFDPEIVGIRRFENSMTYLLAKSRGQAGRVAVTELENIREETRVHGILTGGHRTVSTRLSGIRDELSTRRDDLDRRLDMKQDDPRIPSPKQQKEHPSRGTWEQWTTANAHSLKTDKDRQDLLEHLMRMNKIPEGTTLKDLEKR